MKHFLRFALLAAALTFPSVAQATAKFLVLCTTACTWDNTNDAIWSLSSGGANNTTHPVAADTVTLDASSCVGGLTCTITVNANLAMTSLTMGACTASTAGCILDFSANNNTFTASTVSITGSGTRSLLMGSNTWTITAVTGTPWDAGTVTNLTLTAGASTLDFAATPTANRTINLGSKTYNNVSITNAAASNFLNVFSIGSPTIAGTFTLTNVRNARFGGGITYTFTGAFSYNGTAANPAILYTDGSGATGATTFSVGASNTLQNLTIQNVTKAGAGSITATGSFDGGGNTGVTINGPTGGRIIGG